MRAHPDRRDNRRCAEPPQVVTNAGEPEHVGRDSELTAPNCGTAGRTLGRGLGPRRAEIEGQSIFERFYRSAVQEPDPRGLGLGLWIVKSIVDRHGGSVAAARTMDGRTRFSVTLPVMAAAS